MLTCSNCGAAARPGAKFCTSCGARLPIVQTSEGSGWGTNGDQSPPSSPWGAAPANGQQASPPPEPAPVTASAANDQQAAGNDTPGGAASSPWGQSSGGDQGGPRDAGSTGGSGASGSGSGQSSPSWTWGQPQTDTEAEEDTESATAPVAGEGDSAPGTQPNWISGWTATSNETGASVQNTAPEAARQAPAGDSSAWSPPDATSDLSAGTGGEEITRQPEENANPDARPEWMRNLEAGNQETASDTPLNQTGPDYFRQTTETVEEIAPAASQDAASAETAPATSSAPAARPDGDREEAASDAGVAPQPAASAAPGTAGDAAADSDGAQTEEILPVAASAAPAAASRIAAPGVTSGDALNEAQSLLDRLRDLLPALAAPAPDAPSVNTGGIADQLQNAYDQNARPEFDDLGGVLEAAKERPRDVDTMLNLVARIDPMLDLLHAHGNLLTEISNAVTQLRDQGSNR